MTGWPAENATGSPTLSSADLARLVLVLPTMSAFASGREGEALVEPIRWIVAIVLATFAALVIGGGFLGAFRASKGGESILMGSARGLLKGVMAFLVVGAVSVAVLTIAGAFWVAYAHLAVHLVKPS